MTWTIPLRRPVHAAGSGPPSLWCAKSEPVEEFAFEEDTDGHTGDKYGWMNAAYAMGVNVNRAFKEYGWCTRIRGVESGGEVMNLPTHVFPTDDGGVDLKCPTEIAISDRREHELARNGLIPLIHRKNTDKAAFIGAQSSLQAEKSISGEKGVDATASDNLSARLPYMFAVCAVRSLPEVHGSRQDRFDERKATSLPDGLQELDQRIRRW